MTDSLGLFDNFIPKLNLTIGYITTAIPVKELKGQGIYGIWTTQQSFKGLELLK